MSRRLSPSTSHQIAGHFVRPAYLIELDYSDVETPLRYVVGAKQVIWSSRTWTGQDMNLKGFGWEIKNTGRTSIDIQNIDSVIANAVLSYNVADRPVKVWIIYLHDRNIFYTSDIIASGATQISVTTPIPTDIPVSGNLYYGATDLLINSYFVPYSSIDGRTFNLSSGFPGTLSKGYSIYILNTEYEEEDAVQIFDGVFDEIDLDEKVCTISLAPESSSTQFTPRRRVIRNETTEPKFSVLPQTGLKISWGNELFTLERAKY